VRLLEKATGRPAILRRMPDQAGDVPATYADVEKAHRLLGYAPRVPIEDGLAKYVAWRRNAAR
jgi:UDP-glucuronate 4-epimerase